MSRPATLSCMTSIHPSSPLPAPPAWGPHKARSESAATPWVIEAPRVQRNHGSSAPRENRPRCRRIRHGIDNTVPISPPSAAASAKSCWPRPRRTSPPSRPGSASGIRCVAPPRPRLRSARCSPPTKMKKHFDLNRRLQLCEKDGRDCRGGGNRRAMLCTPTCPPRRSATPIPCAATNPWPG